MTRDEIKTKVRKIVELTLEGVPDLPYSVGVKLENMFADQLALLVPNDKAPINDPSEELIESIREVFAAGIDSPWAQLDSIKRRVEAFELRTQRKPEQPE